MFRFSGVPIDEIEFRASRASGPGGQNVNKRSTRVEARWDVTASVVLNDEQRRKILKRLSTRISGEGVLRVVAYRERSQRQNRELAVERLQELVKEALSERKPRKKKRPSAASKQARLAAKKRRKRTKELRRRPSPDD
jgi:ribosome-associated protein